MALLHRYSIPGNTWSQRDLLSYNIKVIDESLEKFFGTQQLPPLPSSLRSFADTPAPTVAGDDETGGLLHYLDLAHSAKIDEESMVDTFAMWLLQKLDYHAGRHIILSRKRLPLLMCGGNPGVDADICVCDENDYIVLVQGNRTLDNSEHPEPQVVAEAVAAFQYNNTMRVRELHLPVLHEMIIPAITLVGTSPTFYKIRITTELNDAIEAGSYPTRTAEVLRHIPWVPGRVKDGMKPVDNRDVILRYFVEFKKFFLTYS